eukprot:2588326-Alexandrium_andersonii.AAC.1
MPCSSSSATCAFFAGTVAATDASAEAAVPADVPAAPPCQAGPGRRAGVAFRSRQAAGALALVAFSAGAVLPVWVLASSC